MVPIVLVVWFFLNRVSKLIGAAGEAHCPVSAAAGILKGSATVACLCANVDNLHHAEWTALHLPEKPVP